MRLRLLVSCVTSCGTSMMAAAPALESGPAEEVLPPIFVRRAAPETKSGRPSTPGSAKPSPRAISSGLAAKFSELGRRLAPPASMKRATDITPLIPLIGDPAVVQLKPYIVKEDRLPELKERNLLTPKGKLALARRRYPGLGPLNDGVALMLLEEDFAKERRQELNDLKGLLELSDSKVSPATKRMIDTATMRPPDFGEPFRRP